MKTLNIFRSLLIIPILLLSMATVTSVHAGKPDMWEDTYPYDETWLLEEAPCDFDIYLHHYGTVRYQLFFDNEGQITRFHAIYGPMKQTWFANSKTLGVQISGPIHSELVSETEVIETWVGTTSLITVPGYGRVFGSAGYFSRKWDITTDPWTLIEVVKFVGAPYIEDWDPICAYLAP